MNCGKPPHAEAAIGAAEANVVELEGRLKRSKTGRAASDSRTDSMDTLKHLELKHRSLNAELKQFADCDPAYYNNLKQSAADAFEAANRWTVRDAAPFSPPSTAHPARGYHHE